MRMRAIIISTSLVLALSVPADAAPLYLKCEGKDGPREPEPASHSIKIDGVTVEVDGQSAGQIRNSGDPIWVFGDEKEKISGTIDRITARAFLSFNEMGRLAAKVWEGQDTPTPPSPTFRGTCRKAEKFF
jgi:hypothetical protein